MPWWVALRWSVRLVLLRINCVRSRMLPLSHFTLPQVYSHVTRYVAVSKDFGRFLASIESYVMI